MEQQMSSQSITRIVVNGAGGRMGARICQMAHGDARYQLVGASEHASSPHLGRAAVPSVSERESVKIDAYPGTFVNVRSDVVIDFSSPEGLESALQIARTTHAAMLVGTTGLAESHVEMLREEARSRAVLLAANTSLGVAVVARLVEETAKIFLDEADCSLVEAHHIAKKDAPSGTALRLAEAAKRGGAAIRDDQIVAIRGGDVIGEHTIRFAAHGEYVEITHRATSRDLFVRGALRAAAWLKNRSPGWYTIEDALGLSAR